MDVVVCYSPDRLARKLAYQTLLIDEFNKAGSEVRFVKARKVETPEDEMLLQFQGMMAEYERALIIERTRRGKAFRARAGWSTCLAGAGFHGGKSIFRARRILMRPPKTHLSAPTFYGVLLQLVSMRRGAVL